MLALPVQRSLARGQTEMKNVNSNQIFKWHRIGAAPPLSVPPCIRIAAVLQNALRCPRGHKNERARGEVAAARIKCECKRCICAVWGHDTGACGGVAASGDGSSERTERGALRPRVRSLR